MANQSFAAGAGVRAVSQGSVGARMWRRFLGHRLAVVSGVILVLMFVLSFSADPLSNVMGINPDLVKLENRFDGPSGTHLFGTDELGRDVFIRLLYGGQVSLTVGVVTAVFAAIIGTVIGVLAGYFGGRLDAILMRFTDGVIALPLLPLLIVLVAIDLSKLGLSQEVAQNPDVGLYRIIFIIALFGWTTVARLVRAEALSLRNRDFVRSARALGAGHGRIILVHVLPNTVSPLIVATTLSVGNIILLESVLSFLGMGIDPPTASWGNMLTGAQDLIWSSPQLAIWPGLMIFITVMAFNFLGDGLQDALDPRALK